MRFLMTVTLMMVTTAVMAAEYRFLWIDADTGTRVEHAKITARDLGMDGNWWVEKSVLHGG